MLLTHLHELEVTFITFGEAKYYINGKSITAYERRPVQKKPASSYYTNYYFLRPLDYRYLRICLIKIQQMGKNMLLF